MKKGILTMLVAAMAVVMFAPLASAELTTQFYGVVWNRYTHEVKASNIDAPAESTFEIERIYFRHKWADKEQGWEAALTMDFPGAFNVWPKYAYVSFTKLPLLKDIDAKISVGLIKNYFATIDLWEYETIEKSPADLRKIIGSADQGVALTGRIPGGWGQYEVAMHNGSGYKTQPDTNIEKQYSGSLMVLPLPGLMVRGSYFMQNLNAHGTAAQTKTGTGLVLQYATGPIKILGSYIVSSDATKYGAALNPLTQPGLATSGVSINYSVMGLVDILDGLQIVMRYDNYNGDTTKIDDEKNLYVGGINYEVNKWTKIQLQYQLEQLQHATAGGDASHINKLMAQVAWSWKEKR